MISLNIKSEESRKIWNKTCHNVYDNMKEDFKKSRRINTILGDIRKLYKITPARLRTDSSNEIKDLRMFALYLLVHYSTATFEQIIEQFEDITIKTLEDIQNNSNLDTRYDTKIKEFLDLYKDGYLSNIYQNLAFREDINKILKDK